MEHREHGAAPAKRRLAIPAPSPSALVGISVLVLIGGGAIHLSGSGSAVPLEEAPSPVTMSTQSAPSAEPSAGGAEGREPSATQAPSPLGAPAGAGQTAVVVHVSGAVHDPGLVELPVGSRIDDAVHAAGGPTDDADLSAVNLAQPLTDGEQIHLPVPGETPPVSAPAAPGPPGAPAPGDDSRALIDLNTSDAGALEQLPGVGPAIAARIIEHREKNGPFRSVDDLIEVSGIGPATLEKIRDRATV